MNNEFTDEIAKDIDGVCEGFMKQFRGLLIGKNISDNVMIAAATRFYAIIIYTALLSMEQKNHKCFLEAVLTIFKREIEKHTGFKYNFDVSLIQ